MSDKKNQRVLLVHDTPSNNARFMLKLSKHALLRDKS